MTPHYGSSPDDEAAPAAFPLSEVPDHDGSAALAAFPVSEAPVHDGFAATAAFPVADAHVHDGFGSMAAFQVSAGPQHEPRLSEEEKIQTMSAAISSAVDSELEAYFEFMPEEAKYEMNYDVHRSNWMWANYNRVKDRVVAEMTPLPAEEAGGSQRFLAPILPTLTWREDPIHVRNKAASNRYSAGASDVPDDQALQPVDPSLSLIHI